MHRCERGTRCPHRETLDGTIVGAAINPSRGLCEACQRHTERAITALPADYTHLNELLGKGKTVGNEGPTVRMSKTPPIPLRTHIDAVQRAMVTDACQWAATVADVLNIDWHERADTRPGWRLDRACHLLGNAVSAFLAVREAKHTRWDTGRLVVQVRDGLDGALDILALHQRARHYTGQTRLVHRLPVPCPRCESMGLTREDGDDTITCADCGRAYTWAEYEKLCTILAGRAREVAA